tara:strand:+ start:3900 stop:4139 length:240 start_codon:yes stop_codon:yes gene_type:complete
MKAKKLNKVEELEKKVHATIRMTEQIVKQQTFLRDLAIGTLETIKLMPGYEESIQQLKKQAMEQDREDASSEKKLEPLG